MNIQDDKEQSLTNLAAQGREIRKAGGYGYPMYSRYPAIDVEKNTVREYFRVIRKHKWVILATLLTIATIVTIGTLMTRPIYRAQTKIEIGKETERVLAGQRIMEFETANVFNPLYLQTQVEILNSRDLSRRVIQRLNLWDDDEFKVKGVEGLVDSEREVRMVNAFQGRYGVSIGRQSRVATVTFDAYDPALAAEVANTIASEYITWSNESRLQGIGTTKDFLAKRVQEAETELRQSEAELQRYIDEHRLISLDEGGNITIARAEQLNRQLADTENDRRAAEALYQRSKEVPADDLPPVINDPTVQALSRELSRQKQELANLSARYQPNYPAVRQVQEQVRQLEAQLGEAKVRIVRNIETQYQVARKREEDLRQSFGKSKGEAIQQNRESTQLGLLRQKIETSRKNFEDLQQRLRQAEVESDYRPSNIRIVQAAEVPIAPVKPNKMLNIGLSLLIGLGLGVGLAFFLEYLNNTINNADDVERILQLPSLGAIPSLQSIARRRRVGQGGKSSALALNSQELISGHESVSSFAESYRALRTSVLLSSAERAPRKILITSSHPSEGKTTVVANTAISLAQTGARVLVLDADMRRPRCHKILGVDNEVGLSTYLSRDIRLESLIHQHEVPNLFVLPAGPVPPNPSELLSSIKPRVLLSDLESRFDHIVIDSPPVIHVTDALIISPIVDGVVIVVKSGQTPREAVQRAKQALIDVNARIFGIVLNGIDLKEDGYHYNYKYSYLNNHEEA